MAKNLFSRGADNIHWKGGRTVASNGYVLIKRPDHPRADVRGYIYEHRLIAEEMLGRPLRHGEIVHHCNGDKTDNRPANLEVMPSISHHRSKHLVKHPERRAPDQDNPVVDCACGCGETFPRFDTGGRPRRFVTGHNGQRGPLGRFGP